MDKPVQVKLAFPRAYAQQVISELKKALGVSTYADVFRTALNALLVIVRILKKEHKLLEIDECGRSVGVVTILALEPVLIQEPESGES